ncbi:MAG: hypothetical protein LC725_11265, partial [Lentisphaerae bacterium]|nr:hypothetical protein [Lentisphaerota bacterium]
MSILRMILILVLGTLLFVVLQLPDDLHQADAGFAGLADADFRRMASTEWKAGRKAAAVTLLGYAVENRLPDAAACAGVREGYLAVMEIDQSLTGNLALLGLQQGGADSGFESLAGETVAEWFVGGHAPPLSADDEFGAQLTAVRELSSLFPPADPALRLLAIAHAEGLLRAELRQQLRRALGGVAVEESAAAVVTVQETVMPLLQLARQCRSWAEFGTLLRYAGSVDQVKLLARMASLAPLNSGKLARGLMVVEAGER